MLYAIVSDIHANRQAWDAVLNDIRAHGVEEILCLGDIIGYGPTPASVLKSVYAHCKHIITGNHDAALCGRLDPSNFNPRARIALTWTARQLDPKGVELLKSLPLVLQGNKFRGVHASPLSPSQYKYILEPQDADDQWDGFSEQICFVGHSHVPAIFVRRNQGRTRQVPPQDFELEDSKRYIVNIGSVGQPRDGGMLASYTLFDSTKQAVFFREVAFDVEAFRQEMAATELPTDGIGFLYAAEGNALPSVREMIDFAPPDAETEEATVRNVEKLQRSLNRWKMFAALAALVTLLLTFTVVGLVAWSNRQKGVLFERKTSMTLIDDPAVNEQLLQPPAISGSISHANRLQWYDVKVTDPNKQNVSVQSEEAENGTDKHPVFTVDSAVSQPFSITTLPVIAPRGSRFKAAMQFKSPDADDGFVELLLVEKLPNGGSRILARSEPNILDRKDRWYVCSDTIENPLEGGEKITFVIRGEMRGEIHFRKLQFTRTE